MKSNSSFYENVIKGGYDVRSGVYAACDPDISMHLDRYGEYRYVENKALSNPRLAKLSAMSNESKNEDEISKALYSHISGIRYAPIIGFYTGLYAGYVKEGSFRKNASSGGMTTWLLCKLLESGQIDGVIHAHTSQKDGLLFEYGISTTLKQVRDNSKTRYYPLELSSIIKQIKGSHKKYAVVGIPSFIMELRLATDEYPEIRKCIPFMIGLICGHQKSALYTDNLAWQLGIHPDTIYGVNYRQKIDGKPASRYSIGIKGVDDKKVETMVSKQQNTFYGGDWGHGFFKTKFSDYTDDALNETADVALGDAWLPEYASDSKGTNVIIVRNPEIQNIINNGIKSGALKLDTITEGRLLSSQSGLIHHTRDELPYRLWRDEKRGNWHPKKRVSASHALPLLRRKVQDVRERIRDTSRNEFLIALKKNNYALFQSSTVNFVKQYNRLYRIQRMLKITPRRLLRRLVGNRSSKLS